MHNSKTKIPGHKEIAYAAVSVFDNEEWRDMPIKLDQWTKLGAGLVMSCGRGYSFQDAIIFPCMDVPNCGAAFDFHPFPSSGIDEGETLVYSKGISQIPSQKWIEKALTEGIVRITFTKIEDGSERVIFGTTMNNRIPPRKRSKGGSSKSPTQICMFDVELFEWRSCQYSTIREVRIKKNVYPFED